MQARFSFMVVFLCVPEQKGRLSGGLSGSGAAQGLQPRVTLTGWMPSAAMVTPLRSS
jgi:hypothetical protein